MNETEQNDLNRRQSGRETFRDSNSPAMSVREPAQNKSKDDPIHEQDEEPFSIEEDNDVNTADEKPMRKFFMTLLKPTQTPQETPIAYAGWKPAELQQ